MYFYLSNLNNFMSTFCIFQGKKVFLNITCQENSPDVLLENFKHSC